MAGCTIPKPKRKAFDDFDDIPKFIWEEVVVKEQIGTGSFGSVVLARYRQDDIMLKQPFSVEGFEREFLKEVRLLNSVKGYPNVVKFRAVCYSPFAIMQEFVSFSFAPFGDETSASSLATFLAHADETYDFEGFQQVPEVMVADLLDGLAYLHQQDIVHRDLKPANILVIINIYLLITRVSFRNGNLDTGLLFAN